METMFVLMRKDWRLYRAPVIGTVVLGAGPYALYALFALMEPLRDAWLELMSVAATVSLGCIAVVASAFGGMAWAAERADRSATFLALLPPTRLRLAASKLAVAGTWLALCFAADACVGVTFITLSGLRPVGQHLATDFPTLVFQFATFGIVVFGVAWGCSAFLTSSAISAVVGVATGVASSTLVGFAGPKRRLALWIATSLSLALLGVIVGTARAARRVEP